MMEDGWTGRRLVRLVEWDAAWRHGVHPCARASNGWSLTNAHVITMHTQPAQTITHSPNPDVAKVDRSYREAPVICDQILRPFSSLVER